MEVTWPKGYTELYYDIRLHKAKLLQGTVVALDPSSGGSSQPGYAIFRGGELVTSGELDIPSRKSIYERLQILHARIEQLTPEVPDVFAIEMIRGQKFSHEYLKWSVGVSIAAARTPLVIEVPTNVWRALAKVKDGYYKGNAQDAEVIGESLLLLAQEYRDGKR